MYNTNDRLLTSLQPNSLSTNDYLQDIEMMINSKDYHSDEVSETDDEKTQEEIDNEIRPKNKNNNHVLRVHDKPWRSSRVREIYTLNIFNLLTLSLL
jgi:hypothetical protein